MPFICVFVYVYYYYLCPSLAVILNHLGRDLKKENKKQELRAHMALVTRQEEPRAKSSYSMSSNKILRINRLIYKENQRLNAGQD